MAGPGVPAGLRVKQQARTIDFLPTLLEVMGGRAPGYVQGVSLVPVFSGKTVAPDAAYAETLAANAPLSIRASNSPMVVSICSIVFRCWPIRKRW